MDCAAQTELDGSLRRGTLLTDETDQSAHTGVTTAAAVSTTGVAKEGAGEAQKAPPSDILDDLSKDELYAEAADRAIDGRSTMTKAQLVAALRGPTEGDS
jgi:hypothetical protein